MKKAQAAMEFLMTYGWAILVVLAAIGALAYFGVLNPNLGDKCDLGSGAECIDKAVITAGSGTSASIEFVARNTQNSKLEDITISNFAGDCEGMDDSESTDDGTDPGVTVEDEDGNYVQDSYAGASTGKWDNGEKATITIPGLAGVTVDEGQFKCEFDMGYTSVDSGLTHTNSVTIIGEAK